MTEHVDLKEFFNDYMSNSSNNEFQINMYEDSKKNDEMLLTKIMIESISLLQDEVIELKQKISNQETHSHE